MSISEKIVNAITTQANSELQASYYYLKVSYWFKDKGYVDVVSL